MIILMKGILILIFSAIAMLGLITGNPKLPDNIRSIYDFKVLALNGSEIDFAAFKGKKILIVNTASHCGYTKQYDGLEKLYQKYKDRLIVIGFPCNDFLFQEPGNAEEIASFCKLNYGVTFPLAKKITVKGRKTAPLYIWLMNKKYNHLKDSKIKWNFQKYLINENGALTDVFDPDIEPLSDEITKAVER